MQIHGRRLLDEDRQREWTTSAAIADLSGDGNPEIFAVNYLTGDNVYERICQRRDGSPRTCLPQQFRAASDRLYANRGDGEFIDVTDESGIVGSNGKGLGIVVGRFGRRTQPDVFIANDAVPNHFYVSAPREAPGIRLFSEEAIYNGLAVNSSGRAEACMGVAADDLDGDGVLDLFVSNYYGETNTYYVGTLDGPFIDGTMAAGLAQPSLNALGFGAQSIDVDLDGWPDVLVVNGHVEDLRAEGTPYAMRPQLYRNQSGRTFREYQPERHREVLSRALVARSLVRFDMDRDGLDDAVIGCLGDSSIAVRNGSERRGSSLQLQVVGTSSARDGVGTVISVVTAHRVITRQVTAGDGYMACNERLVTVGLGDASRIERLKIEWPSGRSLVVDEPVTPGRYVCIEGRSGIYRIPSTSPRM